MQLVLRMSQSPDVLEDLTFREGKERLNMEIRSLTLNVTEADLNEWVPRVLSGLESVHELRITITREGIRFSGIYQKLFGIRFLVLWHISVSEGKVFVRIETFRSGALSLKFLRGYLLDAIVDASPVIQLRGDALLFDVDAVLQDKGWPLRTKLTAIRCDYGSLLVESGEG
jgi:hypothetical protein